MTRSTVTPAATSPTIPPSASRTGTTARTLGPSVPVNVSVIDRPASGGPVVPRYLRPISSGSGWVTRTVSRSMIVTKSTPVSRVTSSE